MKVFVKALLNGKTFEVEVDSNGSIEDLKQEIQKNEGSPACQQRLILRGKNLKDGDSLAACGIQKDGAMVHLVLRLAASITITIKTMTGKHLALPVKPSDTVGNVMAMVGDLLQMASGQFSLNFEGRHLASELILSKVPITDTAMLRLILRPLSQPSSQSASSEQSRARVYGDLGTLYARCGGIFGIAGFADRCMDKWMADGTLNSNDAVATWHARAQRCGFKFLVTQLMAYLTGGPHRYTGRPIAEAHKHLNISPAEWNVFMHIFQDVCTEFALPTADAEDLIAILTSMEQDCVIHEGEEVPPSPGPVQHDEMFLYGALGGVYPLALFADRLVDALLSDKRVKIPVDGQKRNEASLKYLFTEVVCSISGGPEVITSTELPETRLLLTGRTFFYLLDAAKAASDHFVSGTHRAELIKRLHAAQHLIVDPKRQVRVSQAMRERQQKVEALGHQVGMELIYVPGAGVVKVDFDASDNQLEAAQRGLAELGFKTVEKTRVKTAGEAAAGNMLSSATIAARYAAPGAFVAARKRVHGDPQTLYGKGSGVFGLAKLADQLMESWMSDPALNANRNVAHWHQSQQKSGFKFLVTQVFGYLTGGPQRYTGQPMDVAHKHLGITPAQWDSFMRGFDTVCRNLNIDTATHRDLRSIISAFRDQIIIQDGEQTPADPGLCRKAPSGDSLYAQAGGIYPLAQFADLLVEQSLHSGLNIPWDRSTDLKCKRTPSGLKYVVTELICSAAGGPEVVTSRGFDDAKLGVPADNWHMFLAIAVQAARAVWTSEFMVNCILSMLEEQKTELCFGLAQEDTSAESVARQRLRQAGYSHVETTAALSKCHGDAEEALALLVSGWSPQQLETAAAAFPCATQGQRFSCPFSGMAAGSGQGSCPVSGMSALSQGSMPVNQLHSAASAHSISLSNSSSSSQMAGRVLGSSLQDRLDQLLHEDADLSCPITLILFLDPVIASDGCVYEKAAIQEVLRTQGLSPLTHKPLSPDLFPAHEVAEKAREFMTSRCNDLLVFVRQAEAEGQRGMANAACERLKDYVAIISAQAGSSWHEALERLHAELGQPMLPLPAPSARLERLLGRQVQQVNSDVVGKTDDPQKPAAGSKSVVFTVDVSGSMRGHRMEKARENLLKIFDEYIEDEDQLAMITFDHTTKLQFELQEVGSKREALRHTAERACVVAGGTAFYDALIKTVETLELGSSQDASNQQWVISITDGQDQHSQNSIDNALQKIQASTGKPNLIVVGIQLNDQVKPLMEKLATATDMSIFIDASGGLENLDDAFQQVAELICE